MYWKVYFFYGNSLHLSVSSAFLLRISVMNKLAPLARKDRSDTE